MPASIVKDSAGQKPPIDAPEEPDWAIMAADIEAAEQEKRELSAVVERIPALLTYFTHVVDANGITPIVCSRDRKMLFNSNG
jgi:hypothetical protein